MDDRATTNALLAPGEELSAQEQEVIDEYVRLADNMKKVSRTLYALSRDTSSSRPNIWLGD